MPTPKSLFAAAQPPLSRERAKAIADRVLGFSTADEARVNIGASWSGNTRFAGGEITTAGGITDTSVSITSVVGKRRASATTNVLDDASLKRAVELSERLAKLSPEDPELMPGLAQQSYPTVGAFFESTADLTPEARAGAARRSMDRAMEYATQAGVRDVFTAGFLEAGATASAVANSKGLFAYHASTDVGMSTTVRTPDGTGSGYASGGARDWSQLDAGAIGRRAAMKGVMSRSPQAIEPGRYTVILEPVAAADLVPLLAGAFNARTAEEGRSPFSLPEGKTKVGQKIADERVTIYSDPADPDILSQPFDFEGQPERRNVWIANGELKQLAYSRFWAQRRGVEPTGSLGGLKMTGGTKSVDELVAGTDRGILVTRLWYIRFLEQRTVMVTGLTRDGTFLIEGGKITKPLKHFRFNESPLFMLNKIDELGRPERVSSGIVVPAMKIRDFTFTSLSDAV